MSVILTGFKGCGKSVTGKRLAELMDCAFVDLDERIEQLYESKAKQVLTFREIYRKVGPERFRSLEREALKSVEAENEQVISVGGGTLMDFQNRQLLQKLGKVVLIRVDSEVLIERILADGIPAIFDAENPRASFDALYAERMPVYQQAADLQVETTGLDIEESAQKIYEALQE